MKKLALITLCSLIVAGTSAFAANDLYNNQVRYYNNMKTCKRDSFTYPAAFGGFTGTYKILGKQNGLCVFQEQWGKNSFMTCKLPMDATVKYASEGIKTLNASMSGTAASSAYVNQIINDSRYCN